LGSHLAVTRCPSRQPIDSHIQTGNFITSSGLNVLPVSGNSVERYKIIDVHFPTTDGRTLILSHYTYSQPDHKLLLEQLKLTLPAQPPPRISSLGKLLSQT
jgi:hypothetical protein